MSTHALSGADAFKERCGTVAYDSWAGRRLEHVRVIGETPKRYRVRFADGSVKLVPKHATYLLLPLECLTHDAPARAAHRVGTGGEP